MEIRSGAGGTEAMDWAEMLLRVKFPKKEKTFKKRKILKNEIMLSRYFGSWKV